MNIHSKAFHPTEMQAQGIRTTLQSERLITDLPGRQLQMTVIQIETRGGGRDGRTPRSGMTMGLAMAWCHKKRIQGRALTAAGPGAGRLAKRTVRALLRLALLGALVRLEAMALTLMEPLWILLANCYLLPFALFSLVGLKGGQRVATVGDEDDE